MKAKLNTALKSNVDPFFFVLACAMLLSLCATAKALADDVLEAVTDPPGALIALTTDGELTLFAE